MTEKLKQKEFKINQVRLYTWTICVYVSILSFIAYLSLPSKLIITTRICIICILPNLLFLYIKLLGYIVGYKFLPIFEEVRND